MIVLLLLRLSQQPHPRQLLHLQQQQKQKQKTLLSSLTIYRSERSMAVTLHLIIMVLMLWIRYSSAPYQSMFTTTTTTTISTNAFTMPTIIPSSLAAVTTKIGTSKNVPFGGRPPLTTRIKTTKRIITSQNNVGNDEETDASTTANETEIERENLIKSSNLVTKHTRRQKIRKFFRRLYSNNFVAFTIRKLLFRFQRRTNHLAKDNKFSIGKFTTKDQKLDDTEVADEKSKVDSSLSFFDSVTLNNITATALSYGKYGNHFEQWNGTWNIIISDEFMNEYDTYLQRLGQPYLVRSIAKNIIGATREETLIRSSKSDTSSNIPSLLLRSINARGVWERSLVASDIVMIQSTSIECHDTDSMLAILSNYTYPNTSIRTTVVTADKECVTAEAWWVIVVTNENGSDTKSTTGSRIYHHSWLRGVTKYGGGDFESIRYLESQPSYKRSTKDGNIVDQEECHPPISSNILVCHSMFHPSNAQQKESARVTWRFRRIE